MWGRLSRMLSSAIWISISLRRRWRPASDLPDITTESKQSQKRLDDSFESAIETSSRCSSCLSPLRGITQSDTASKKSHWVSFSSLCCWEMSEIIEWRPNHPVLEAAWHVLTPSSMLARRRYPVMASMFEWVHFGLFGVDTNWRKEVIWNSFSGNVEFEDHKRSINVLWWGV